PSRLGHILDWTHAGGIEAGGPLDRGRPDEPALVSCNRGTPQQSQPDVRSAVYRLHHEDAYDFHSQLGVHRRLERFLRRWQVDCPRHFSNQPDFEDWETADQPPNRRQILCRYTALRPQLGRPLRLDAAVSNGQTSRARREDQLRKAVINW